MKKIHERITPSTGLLILISALGCGQAPDYRDQRLAEFAQKSVTEQAQQNAQITEVIKREASSRQELFSLHQSLTKQLNQQQAGIDAARNRLESDRSEIAQQRFRDPIIAAVLQTSGIMIACLLPLLVAVFGVWQMQSQEPDHAAVANLLVAELTSPRFLHCQTPNLARLGTAPGALPLKESDAPPF